MLELELVMGQGIALIRGIGTYSSLVLSKTRDWGCCHPWRYPCK
jgi:hypothetical protein